MSLMEDVDRGLEIREQIERLESELKDIETRLQMSALKHPDEQVSLVDVDRDGKRWLAGGSRQVVPVILTADLLIGEFGASTARAGTILTASRGKMAMFFRKVSKYENLFDNGKKFRRTAEELLNAAAPNFITACLARDREGQPKSRIVVAWKEAEAKPKV